MLETKSIGKIKTTISWIALVQHSVRELGFLYSVCPERVRGPFSLMYHAYCRWNWCWPFLSICRLTLSMLRHRANVCISSVQVASFEWLDDYEWWIEQGIEKSVRPSPCVCLVELRKIATELHPGQSIARLRFESQSF
jgi:hypothetical protein